MNNLISGKILFCNKKSLWITTESSIIYTNFEKNNKFVPNQSIKIDKTKLKKIQVENIEEQIPHIINAVCSYCELYYIEYKNIFAENIDPNYTILCGVLCISSKIRWGITSKSLTKYTFVPRNKGYPKYIVASKLKPSSIDVYARVEINKLETNETHPKGILVEVLGNINDSSIFEKVILASYPIFPRNRNLVIRNENKKISTDYDSEIIRNYKDIIDEDWSDDMTISIDPENCTDIDDAISIRKNKDSVEYAIHIATPTLHYDINSDIDKLAISQMNSIYMSNKVHHLIPSKLSENKASLRKNCKRICLSVIWTNSNHVRLVRSIIENKFEFSYTEVERNSIYSKFVKLYESIFNEKIINSHELVEKSMIKANSYIAEFLLKNSEDTALLRKSLNNNVYYLPSSESNTHDPLGLNCYTHFTSPIRRYADQIVHRQLFDILSNKKTKPLKHETTLGLNLSKCYCQMIESDKNWISILKGNSQITLEGKLLYVQDYKAKVEIILNDNTNIRIFIPLISHKIEELFIITGLNEEYSLEYLHSNTNLKFKTESNIIVELYFTENQGLDGYKFKWIEPNIEEFINQFCI
tara:strand:- start:1490 stop:3244 length:1755 start_codon:yes stop_codon:yes gene_type:complete